jgi:hypothetical protein
VFVTHNIHDFSHIGVHEHSPHPDIAKYFSSKSHYFTKLGDALNKFRPDEYNDIMVEQSWFEPPRRYIDILEIIEKLREQVWYNRHQVWLEKLTTGEAVIIEDNEERGKDPFGLRTHRSIFEGARTAARKVEKKYGVEELGPWSDFEWGMINGKLSALRWVLGDDWDMLDT